MNRFALALLALALPLAASAERLRVDVLIFSNTRASPYPGTPPRHPDDARAISDAHRSAWQQAYEGLIPHKALRQMVDRRNEAWWSSCARSSWSWVSVTAFILPTPRRRWRWLAH